MYHGTSAKTNVPLDHMDFKFITECTDITELEHILTALRSKEEGFYPDLETHCEERLRKLAPNNQLLRKATPLTSKHGMGTEEWSALNNDMSNWTKQMTHLDTSLRDKKLTDDLTTDALPVRKSNKTSQIGGDGDGVKNSEVKTNKNPMPRSFNEWEKVDIDAELAKVDNTVEPALPTPASQPKPMLNDMETEGLTDVEKSMKAGREKDKGNEAFKSGDFEESVVYYSRSIKLHPSIHAFNNRALSYLRLEKWKSAIRDCKYVLKQEPDNIKALMRCGSAYHGKKDYKRAEGYFERVLVMEPANRQAQDLLLKIEKEKHKDDPSHTKVKGHRMVIEEVEGGSTNENEDSAKITEMVEVNGDSGESKENHTYHSDEVVKDEDNKNGSRHVSDEFNAQDDSSCITEKKDKDFHDKNAKEKNNHLSGNSGSDAAILNVGGDVGHEANTKNNFNNLDGNVEKENKVGSEKHVLGNDKEVNVANQQDILRKLDELLERENKVRTDEGEGDGEKDENEDMSAWRENTANERREKRIQKNIKLDEFIGLNCENQKPGINVENCDGVGIEGADVSEKLGSNTEDVKLEPRVFVRRKMRTDIEIDKEAGNVLFKAGQYPEALEKYTAAIEKLIHITDNEIHLSTLYTNRATCNLKIGDTAGVIRDCGLALDVLPNSVKPLLRRAAAYEQTESYADALRDYKQVLMLDSTIHIAYQGSSRCLSAIKEVYGYAWESKLKPVPPVLQHEIPCIIDEPGLLEKSETKSNIAITTASLSIDSSEPVNKEGDKNKQESQQLYKKKEMQNYTTNEPMKTVELTDSQLYDKWKEEGNKFVKNGDYSNAVDLYTKCVEKLPDRAVAYTNRALCYLKLNQNDNAIKDCTHVLSLEPNNVKALFRRSQGKKNLEEYKDCLADLSKLLKLDSNNSAAKKEIEVTKELWRQQLQKLKQSTTKKPETKSPTKTRRLHIEEVEEDGIPEANPVTKENKPESAASDNVKTTPSLSVPTTVPTLTKVTPYEFMNAWNSLKMVKGTQLHAKLIRQVRPERLAKVLTNKLDGDILTRIINCVSDHILPEDDYQLAFSILQNLTKVQRFTTVSNFLSKHEKLVVEEILCKLRSRNSGIYNKNDIDALQKAFSL